MKGILVLILLIISGYTISQELPRLINVDDQIIVHKAYTLSYNETCEQANWVKYILTEEDLDIDNKVAKRKNNFKSDPKVSTGSSTKSDYKSSGFDRGHLAPAANFFDNQVEMDESFLLSNISPQTPSFNRGIWRKLENYERLLCVKNKYIIVITGPILSDNLDTIGENNVCIPVLFFKIIYNMENGLIICFLMKNEKSNEPLSSFIQPLEVVEEYSKINFNIK